MSPDRAPLSHRLPQAMLLAVGLLLAGAYLLYFEDPPYPALVPAVFWFFYLGYLILFWLLRRLGGAAGWKHVMAMGLAAAATIALYLAGHVGEQQREIDLQERQLSD